MESVYDRITTLGINIPKIPNAEGLYSPYVIAGDLVYISGQIPTKNGKLIYKGQLSPQQVNKGVEASRLCGVNILGILNAACNGSLDRVVQCVKLTVYINANAEFTAHPDVANGASGLIIDVFAEKGKHSRAAAGYNGLPLGASVEVDAIFQIN